MLRSRDPQICHFHGRGDSGSVRVFRPATSTVDVSEDPLVKRLGGRERQLHGRMSGQFIQLATYDVSDLTLIAPASSQHWAPAKTKRVRCQLHPHDSLMGGKSPPTQDQKPPSTDSFMSCLEIMPSLWSTRGVEQAAPLHSSRGATGF